MSHNHKTNSKPNRNPNWGEVFLGGNCLVAPTLKTNSDLDANPNPNSATIFIEEQLSGTVINEWPLTNSFLLLNMIFLCFSISLRFLCLFYVFSLFCMLNKRDKHYLKKRRGTTNLKINLKMHHTQVSFIWIKKARNK